MQDRRRSIILAAHGEAGESGRNSALTALESRVRSEFPMDEVEAVLFREDGALTAALNRREHDDALVLPLMFSEGHFFSRKVRDAVAAVTESEGQDVIVLDRPCCFWPELCNAVVEAFSGCGRVLVVAHGSMRSSASRDAALEFAGRLSSQSGMTVSCGFLEEAPFARELAVSQEGSFGLFGLFLGDGLHGGQDFAEIAAASRTPPRPCLTVGALSQLSELVLRRIRSQMNQGSA